eukprot:m.714264 g.714264  ORF g.714264 m.714264 type:complete len:248 (+) comp22971_c1_seq95:1214-1957(+)
MLSQSTPPCMCECNANWMMFSAQITVHNQTHVSQSVFMQISHPILLHCQPLLCGRQLLLGKRYSLLHYLGILVALVGMGGIIAADTLASDASDRAAGSNPLLGDMLCVTAAALYACSNVGEEYVVCQADKTHFLGMVGLFGAVLSAVQGAVLEHDRVRAIAWTPDIVALFVGYVASLFALYSLVPLLIARSSAMMFNLSMVSADFYSFLIGMFLFKSNFQMLYFVSFPVVLVGLGMYIKAPERIESS